MADAWDGKPDNPDRDGWHWLQSERGSVVAPKEWRAGETRRWCMSNGELRADFQIADRYRYLGPCHTPAEVAALVEAAGDAIRAQARREGMEAAARWHITQADNHRAVAAKWADGSLERRWHNHEARQHDEHAATIRAAMGDGE